MIVFLMIARVLYDKGYQQYVDAAYQISKEFQNVKFQLLGDIDVAYPNHVPLEIVKNDSMRGCIEYLGYQSNVYSIIKGADCIVLPTYYNEGLSRVLMEGLAMSKPIITTDIPGCRETVDDGINGFLCKPKDTSSLIDAFRKFLSMTDIERMEMGRNGRYKAERQFDIKSVISVYSSITNKYI